MQANLTSLGFNRIGSTNYFQQGGFIVENSDPIVVWSDMNAEADGLSTFVGVTCWSLSSSSTPHIGVVHKNFDERLEWISSTFNGSINGDYSGRLDVLRVSPRKQAALAGFSPLVGDIIYSCVGEDGYDYLIAFERDQIIAVAIKAVLPTPITNVVKYSSKIKVQSCKEERLDVVTGKECFEIINSGVGIKSIKSKK